MTPQLTGDTALAETDRRRPRWRDAFAGLTPKVVAFVATLMMVRQLGNNPLPPLAGNFHDIGAWLRDVIGGFCMLMLMATPIALATVATANLGPQRGARRAAALATAVVLSTGAAVFLRVLWYGEWSWRREYSGMLAYVWLRYAILAGLLTLVGEFFRRETASNEAMQRALADHAAFEREMTEARLAVLQAQIEPHFLFNTLANVRRLYDQDPAAGRRMLLNVMRYFEVALPRMRGNDSTLERDSDLVEAFLHIQQIRMGQRLAFSVAVPDDLRAHRVPPMMLLSLVENAIKHGIGPSPHGGRIDVEAHTDGDRLVLCVVDTGVGFGPASGMGTGLANISARLAAQFGQRASLALENNERGGATATLVLPLDGHSAN